MFKKKSLGQHFLHNAHYVRAVADAAELSKGDAVLEVGLGDGALTQELLAKKARVIAIEKDSRLIPLLEQKFAGQNFSVVEGDALDFNPVARKLTKYKVVANIPYYITGALFKKFLTATRQPTTLVFLIQKEVAERIARSKKESLLSLSVKAYGEPTIITRVPRGAFTPPPEVDSAIVRIKNISRKNFTSKKHEERFFALLHAGFAQKRKLLASNLRSSFKNSPDALQKANIPANARAEDVSLPQWRALAQILEP